MESCTPNFPSMIFAILNTLLTLVFTQCSNKFVIQINIQISIQINQFCLIWASCNVGVIFMRYKVLGMGNIKIVVFWAWCHTVWKSNYQCFNWSCRLHLQGRSEISSTVKMAASSSSKTQELYLIKIKSVFLWVGHTTDKQMDLLIWCLFCVLTMTVLQKAWKWSLSQ